MSFGETVKRLRKERGLSQEAVAKELGVSQRYVSKVETGETANPTMETVRSFARILNVGVLDLLAESERAAA